MSSTFTQSKEARRPHGSVDVVDQMFGWELVRVSRVSVAGSCPLPVGSSFDERRLLQAPSIEGPLLEPDNQAETLVCCKAKVAKQLPRIAHCINCRIIEGRATRQLTGKDSSFFSWTPILAIAAAREGRRSSARFVVGQGL